MKIAFSANFFCKYCKRDILVNVFGDREIDKDDKEYENEAKKWGEHCHWIEYHRRCALCGGLVVYGDLELLVNDGKIKIHEEYQAQT